MSSASESINPNKLFLVEAALVLVFITAMEITNIPGTVTHAYNSSTEEAKERDSEIQHHSWLCNEFEVDLGKTLAFIFSFLFFFKDLVYMKEWRPQSKESCGPSIPAHTTQAWAYCESGSEDQGGKAMNTSDQWLTFWVIWWCQVLFITKFNALTYLKLPT